MFPGLCHGLVTHAAHAELISANNPEVQQGRRCAVVSKVQSELNTQPQAGLPMSHSLELVLSSLSEATKNCRLLLLTLLYSLSKSSEARIKIDQAKPSTMRHRRHLLISYSVCSLILHNWVSIFLRYIEQMSLYNCAPL